uniref:DNA replication protein n=1 Tax=Klebsiella pneumoniae TaxID=573 RepID=A0A6M6A3Z8_KLEPN|nr:DNA replication protein [Klebsiella pneumoniae]QJX13572.1 DNA replication protein [Klebsiella pneumoniae]
MGSCAAPSAKGDDKFITTDYLQQCREMCAEPLFVYFSKYIQICIRS